MSSFLSSGLKRTRTEGSPNRSPPIPITRTTSDAMNIPGRAFNSTDRSTSTKKNKYSQSVPLPRAPIIGSCPNPTSMGFEKMPTLELPPSYKEDEIHQNFGAPGTSLGSNHRGYAASCPAPSFMSQASSASRRIRAADDQTSSGGGSYGEPDAQTPSYNTPSMGSRTVLSVLLETDETTEYQDEGRQGGLLGGGSSDVNMEMPINLQRLDLSSTNQATGEDDDEPMPEGDDDDGLFQMDE